MDGGSSFAILEDGQRKAQKWVKVGDSLDGVKVVRIERSRVVVFDGKGEVFLYADLRGGSPITPPGGTISGSAGGTAGAATTPAVSSPPPMADKKGVEQGALDAVLNREFEEMQKAPYLVTESDRKGLVKEIAGLFQAGKMIPASRVLSIEGGEEVVVGMKSPSDISGLGIQKEDILLHINGISLDSKESWEDILGVIEGARLISYAFLRGNQIYSQLYEVR